MSRQLLEIAVFAKAPIMNPALRPSPMPDPSLLLLCCAAAEGPLLADYKEHHTDVSVHFEVEVVPGKLSNLLASNGLETKLKLASKISTGKL
jgi:hypothetical protein